jgi:diadenosine tetraphosphate (Ap4A) HIT family hydrolase
MHVSAVGGVKTTPALGRELEASPMLEVSTLFLFKEEPNKINYGASADKQCHLHFHIVPKYADRHNWGSTFEMMPQPKLLLSDAEYQG